MVSSDLPKPSNTGNPPLPLIEAIQSNSNCLIASISLVQPLPDHIPVPKFQMGQIVVWVNVATHGFGKIIGFVLADGVSVKGLGYHYLIHLAPDSPSHQDCKADWAFEEDLELLESYAHLLHPRSN